MIRHLIPSHVCWSTHSIHDLRILVWSGTYIHDFKIKHPVILDYLSHVCYASRFTDQLAFSCIKLTFFMTDITSTWIPNMERSHMERCEDLHTFEDFCRGKYWFLDVSVPSLNGPQHTAHSQLTMQQSKLNLKEGSEDPIIGRRLNINQKPLKNLELWCQTVTTITINICTPQLSRLNKFIPLVIFTFILSPLIARAETQFEFNQTRLSNGSWNIVLMSFVVHNKKENSYNCCSPWYQFWYPFDAPPKLVDEPPYLAIHKMEHPNLVSKHQYMRYWTLILTQVVQKNKETTLPPDCKPWEYEWGKVIHTGRQIYAGNIIKN